MNMDPSGNKGDEKPQPQVDILEDEKKKQEQSKEHETVLDHGQSASQRADSSAVVATTSQITPEATEKAAEKLKSPEEVCRFVTLQSPYSSSSPEYSSISPPTDPEFEALYQQFLDNPPPVSSPDWTSVLFGNSHPDLDIPRSEPSPITAHFPGSSTVSGSRNEETSTSTYSSTSSDDNTYKKDFRIMYLPSPESRGPSTSARQPGECTPIFTSSDTDNSNKSSSPPSHGVGSSQLQPGECTPIHKVSNPQSDSEKKESTEMQKRRLEIDNAEDMSRKRPKLSPPTDDPQQEDQ